MPPVVLVLAVVSVARTLPTMRGLRVRRISTSTILVFLVLSFPSIALACSSSGSSSTDSIRRYLDEIAPSVGKYNSARDEVDKVIRDLDYGKIPANRLEFLTERVAILESATLEMNDASRSFGQYDAPPQFREHQAMTLKARRSGIEASIAVKLYVQEFLQSGRVNSTLVTQANRLFGDEDRSQFEARNALQP